MLSIDTIIGRPIYTQLYWQIRQKILSGEWIVNAKLPSSRQLANDLQISRNTVEQAYQQLCAEGYLYSKSRQGYYVGKLEGPFINQNACNTSSTVNNNISCSNEKDQYRYDFRYGKLDYKYVPSKIWKKLMIQCFEEEVDKNVSYGEPQGEIGLREQIMKYVEEYRGVKCQPEQIVIGAGTLHCLGLLCNILRQFTSTVAFEDPGYGKTRAVLHNAGFQVCPISVESDGINVQELANSEALAVYVTPSHQFPTGAIMSISKRLQLLEWAVRKQAIIIEDDYSCHLRYNVRPIPALQGISPMANVVYFGNFSKPLLPSLRIAFMILPPSLLNVYKTLYRTYNTSVPYLYQRTLERFMEEGYWNRHLRRVLQVYKKKHECLMQSLKEQFCDLIAIHGNNAGLFITIKVNSHLFETDLIQRAAGYGVRVYPVSEHWQRIYKYDRKTVLLGYSSLDLEEIKQAVRLLRKAWFD